MIMLGALWLATYAVPTWPAVRQDVIRFSIAAVSVSNLVGDQVIGQSVADSLFRRLMGLTVFDNNEIGPVEGGGQGLAAPRTHLALTNRLLIVPSPPSDSTRLHPHELTVQLDLEQCYYGPVEAKSNLLIYLSRFWSHAELSALLTVPIGSDLAPVLGFVQWRATIHSSDDGPPVIVVAQGGAVGNPLTLDRRHALLQAAKRAMYRLGYQMTVAINTARSIHARKVVVQDDRSYVERSDAW